MPGPDGQSPDRGFIRYRQRAGVSKGPNAPLPSHEPAQRTGRTLTRRLPERRRPVTLPGRDRAPGTRGLDTLGSPGHPPPPRQVGGVADADPARRCAGAPVVRTPSSTTATPRSRDHEVGAVVGAGRCPWPGTAWPGRSSSSVVLVDPGPRPPRMASSPATGASARSRTASAVPVGPAHHVGAEVHAVGEVHVEVAGRPEHGGVARRSGPGRRARPGPRSPGTPPPRRCGPPARRRDEHLVEQLRGHLERAAVVEPPGQHPTAAPGPTRPAHASLSGHAVGRQPRRAPRRRRG